MADELAKLVAPQAAPTARGMLPPKGRLTKEQRRTQDALEDDEVREALKELHAQKAKSGQIKNG